MKIKQIKIVSSAFSSSTLVSHPAIVIDSCLCTSNSFPWLSKIVTRQEFVRNIALNGQAFKTHERSRFRERHASSRTLHPNNFMLQPFGYCVWIAESVLQHERCVIHFRTTECDAYEMSFICFFEYVTLHTPRHHHRPDLVHVEELSMTAQELHEAGQHEGLVNISLNGEAFKTHAWRLRKSSVSSLSHMFVIESCEL